MKPSSTSNTLAINAKQVDSVFQLLGTKENHISYSVAWALVKCPAFLEGFVVKVLGRPIKGGDIQIRLQTHEKDRGYTDIEIECKNEFFLIIEAKRGWNIPGMSQLKKYRKRRSFEASKAKHKKLVILSECSHNYVRNNLTVGHLGGISIESMSWKNVAGLAKSSLRSSNHAQKRLLAELLVYLRGLMTMQKNDSNMVYVVAISSQTPRGWGISWIDIIERKHCYFHPMGVSGWPKEPPNYMGFRYDGRLQSIHHVDSYKVIDNLHGTIRQIPHHKHQTLFLYKLGPAIKPSQKVSSVGLWRNGHVWCMLDTLLTSSTIAEARSMTRLRLESN